MMLDIVLENVSKIEHVLVIVQHRVRIRLRPSKQVRNVAGLFQGLVLVLTFV